MRDKNSLEERIIELAPADETELSETGRLAVRRSYPAPVTRQFLRRLARLGIKPVASPASLPTWQDYVRLNDWLVTLPQEDLVRSGIHCRQPPSGLHGHLKDFLLDLHSCDIMVHALAKCQRRLESGGRYLDFGCSTGRTLETLHKYDPSLDLMGCDPVVSSIEWAQRNRDGIEFFVSPVWPRLPFAERELDGVYANSVWTHFSELAAVTWLFEMYRVLKPGGFLCMTTKGFMSIGFALTAPEIFKTMLAPAADDEGYVLQVLERLAVRGFFFTIAKYDDESANDDWGQTFVAHHWLDTQCKRVGFRREVTLFNAWGFKQDLHVLVRT